MVQLLYRKVRITTKKALSMQLEKYTIKAQEAVQKAQQMAIELENQAIECGHLLKAIWRWMSTFFRLS